MTALPLDPQDHEHKESVNARVIVDDQGLLRCDSCETVLRAILQDLDDVYLGKCPYCGRSFDEASLQRATRELPKTRSPELAKPDRQDDIDPDDDAEPSDSGGTMNVVANLLWLGFFEGHQLYPGWWFGWFGTDRAKGKPVNHPNDKQLEMPTPTRARSLVQEYEQILLIALFLFGPPALVSLLRSSLGFMAAEITIVLLLIAGISLVVRKTAFSDGRSGWRIVGDKETFWQRYALLTATGCLIPSISLTLDLAYGSDAYAGVFALLLLEGVLFVYWLSRWKDFLSNRSVRITLFLLLLWFWF